ncbi:MAG: 4'-phosphopantetheinyl transferase superfamily protein [Paludibacteraceae bacterium]|nr:4'-phosphopantetheinyl transferase superfamily protein [Paludibacteraceae bacterium]
MLNYIIFDDIAQCTEADIARLKLLASPQRLEQAMRFKHMRGQWNCLKSYELLCRLLQTEQPLAFRYNDYGKPYLTQDTLNCLRSPYRFFSISHCKEAIAVAVSDQEIGIDIESRNRRISPSLIQSEMNVAEQDYINRHPNPATAFIELWTKKEAVLKQRGTGIIDHLQNVLTGNEPVQTHIYDTYILSICNGLNN